MSHLCLFLGLEQCQCACLEGAFVFADTVGSGTGTRVTREAEYLDDPHPDRPDPDLELEPCTVYYYAEFHCDGTPHFPGVGPTIKFEPYPGCEPEESGSATLCFYSQFGPTLTGMFPNLLGIKAGQNIGVGPLVGVLTLCEGGPSAVQMPSWSGVKALYR